MFKVDPSKYIAPPSKVALFLVNVNDNTSGTNYNDTNDTNGINNTYDNSTRFLEKYENSLCV